MRAPCMLVASDSSATPRTIARQAPLPMGIPQARILEWAATFFSRENSRPRDGTRVSCIGGRGGVGGSLPLSHLQCPESRSQHAKWSAGSCTGREQ